MPDILGLERLLKNHPDLKMRYSPHDIGLELPIEALYTRVFGQLLTIVGNPNLSPADLSPAKLQALLVNDIDFVLDSLEKQLEGDVDKLLAIIEDSTAWFTYIWNEPLKNVPFFSDLFENKLQMKLTLGGLTCLLPALQSTLGFMIEHEGREPFPYSGSPGGFLGQKGTLSVQSDPLEVQRFYGRYYTIVDAGPDGLLDTLKSEMEFGGFGKDPSIALCTISLITAAAKWPGVYYRSKLHQERVKVGEVPKPKPRLISIDGMSALSLLDTASGLVPLLTKIYGVVSAIKARRTKVAPVGDHKNTSEHVRKPVSKHAARPNDGLCGIECLSLTLGWAAFASASFSDASSNKRYARFHNATGAYAVAKAFRSLRLTLFLSNMNSTDGIFEDFVESPLWAPNDAMVTNNLKSVMLVDIICGAATSTAYWVASSRS